MPYVRGETLRTRLERERQLPIEDALRIALAVQHAAGARMTQTGLSLGTPQYMSPEQAMGEKTLDARSDIYALGAVTYEILVGEPPFTGPTVQTIVAKVLTERPTAPRALRDT